MLKFQKPADRECRLDLNASKPIDPLLRFRLKDQEWKEDGFSVAFERTMRDAFPKELSFELWPLIFFTVQELLELACTPKSKYVVRLLSFG